MPTEMGEVGLSLRRKGGKEIFIYFFFLLLILHLGMLGVFNVS